MNYISDMNIIIIINFELNPKFNSKNIIKLLIENLISILDIIHKILI